jgi:hypothetical protein
MSTQHTRNILKVYRRATDAQRSAGFNWYGEAHDLALEIGNGDVWRGAGLLAVYSPLTPWWRNVELALGSARTGIARTDTLGNSARLAQRILDGEYALDVINGIKTRTFCENIALNGISDNVTVDVHAYSIAVGRPVPSSRLKMGVRLYREIEEAYRRAAKREGVMETQMQAVSWVVWRDMFHKKAARKGETVIMPFNQEMVDALAS